VLALREDSELSAQFDRVKFAPPGRCGGGAGATARISVLHDGVETELPGKVLAYPIAAGDQVVIETQGGGGFGPPSQRSAAAVARDLAEGRISAGAARTSYPHVEVE
jgi:N-methylhydantoinase B